jgi:hypothetical protein
MMHMHYFHATCTSLWEWRVSSIHRVAAKVDSRKLISSILYKISLSPGPTGLGDVVPPYSPTQHLVVLHNYPAISL